MAVCVRFLLPHPGVLSAGEELGCRLQPGYLVARTCRAPVSRREIDAQGAEEVRDGQSPDMEEIEQFGEVRQRGQESFLSLGFCR